MRARLSQLCMLLALTPCANAQSSVQLYGVVDVGTTYNSDAGAGSQVRVNSGNLSGSRFGMRGKEDLGGGLGTVFALESGFAADTGVSQQGSRLFGRQAFVGLSDARWGTLTVGRQYPVFAFPVGGETAALRYGTSIMVHPLDLDFVAGTMRFNNALNYESAVFGGLAVRGQYALGEVAGDPGNNRAWSLGAGFERSGLRINLGYAGLDRPATASNPGGAVSGDYQTVLPLWLRQFDANSAGRSTPSSASVGIGRQRTGAMSVVYDHDTWRLGLVATRTTLDRLSISGAANSALNTSAGLLRQTVVELNGTYQFIANNMTGVMVSYTKADFDVPGSSYGPAWWHFGLGNLYTLSKRTDIYAALGYQRANGQNNVAVMGQTIASGRTQVSAVVGLRHRF